MDVTESEPLPITVTPEPHLPLRKATAQQLRSRQSAPQPLFSSKSMAEKHQVRGFNPSPVQATPGLADLTASNEHAFAGKQEQKRKPFNLKLSEQALVQGMAAEKVEVPAGKLGGGTKTFKYRPPSSPLVPSPLPSSSSPKTKQKPLRSRRSFGDGLKGLRNRLSNDRHGDKHDSSPVDPMPPLRPSIVNSEARDSFRSAVTNSSSVPQTNSIYTTHSSWTNRSSSSDFVNVYPNWPEGAENGRPGSMTVEDAIGMYEDGFESIRGSIDVRGDGEAEQERVHSSGSQSKKSWDAAIDSSMEDIRSGFQPIINTTIPEDEEAVARQSSDGNLSQANGKAMSRLKIGRTTSQQKRTFSQILAPRLKVTDASIEGFSDPSQSRDRYGFKTTSHYVTAEMYDAWNVQYSEHLDRRTKKWEELMASYGLSTDKPFRFPPKSDKIKRYVRKGIPPDLRGAAWFWYAGGPGKLASDRGLYHSLLEDIEQGKLSENDREHIERDLNRTFPDNVRFKPDVTNVPDKPADEPPKRRKGKGSNTASAETPMLCALRRVLQAFAVHNPSIGYCQSLNFLAGLLLLFLDEDEEKAFTLMNIVTSQHLPGTHGVALEGANIDIAVLMSCIKESLPAVWAKLDDKGRSSALPAPVAGSAQALRLPTVSLATTAWFMSLFVGTLPIESVLRVWDCLFFEGSKTLFRVALAIFKAAEPQIIAVGDPMEIFQLVQSVPRSMLDINSLLDVCFRRRGGFAHVSQEMVERKRSAQRDVVQEGLAGLQDMNGRAWKRFRAKSRV